MKAMILAAGNGTRLKPLTNTKPKALVKIKGIPLLEIVIRKLKKHGFTDIVINVHHFADMLIDFVKAHDFGVNIEISDERKQLLDTGGAILKAKDYFINEPAFLVYNVDILSDIDLSDLYQAHIKSNNLVTMAVKERPTSRQLLFDDKKLLCQWKNIETGKVRKARQPFGALKPLAFSGIHILDTDIFQVIKQKGCFSIIDTYLDLAANYPIAYYLHNNSQWFDMGRYAHVQQFNQDVKTNSFINNL